MIMVRVVRYSISDGTGYTVGVAFTSTVKGYQVYTKQQLQPLTVKCTTRYSTTAVLQRSTKHHTPSCWYGTSYSAPSSSAVSGRAHQLARPAANNTLRPSQLHTVAPVSYILRSTGTYHSGAIYIERPCNNKDIKRSFDSGKG